MDQKRNKSQIYWNIEENKWIGMNGSRSNINIYIVYTIHMHIWIAFAYLPHVSSTLLPKNLYCSLTLVVSYYYDFFICVYSPPHCCHGKSQSRTIFFPIFFVMCLDLFQAAADWNFITGKLKNDWRQKKSRNQECNFNMMLIFCYWFNEFHFFLCEIWCLSHYGF